LAHSIGTVPDATVDASQPVLEDAISEEYERIHARTLAAKQEFNKVLPRGHTPLRLCTSLSRSGHASGRVLSALGWEICSSRVIEKELAKAPTIETITKLIALTPDWSQHEQSHHLGTSHADASSDSSDEDRVVQSRKQQEQKQASARLHTPARPQLKQLLPAEDTDDGDLKGGAKSCHQCKVVKPLNMLYYCRNRKQRVHKGHVETKYMHRWKFCAPCLTKYMYYVNANVSTHPNIPCGPFDRNNPGDVKWLCPACDPKNSVVGCICRWCTRKACGKVCRERRNIVRVVKDGIDQFEIAPDPTSTALCVQGSHNPHQMIHAAADTGMAASEVAAHERPRTYNRSFGQERKQRPRKPVDESHHPGALSTAKVLATLSQLRPQHHDMLMLTETSEQRYPLISNTLESPRLPSLTSDVQQLQLDRPAPFRITPGDLLQPDGMTSRQTSGAFPVWTLYGGVHNTQQVMQQLMQMSEHIPFVPSLMTPTTNLPVNAQVTEPSQSPFIPDSLLRHLQSRSSPSPTPRKALQPYAALCSPTKEVPDADATMAIPLSTPRARKSIRTPVSPSGGAKQPRNLLVDLTQSGSQSTPVKRPGVLSDAYLLASPR
jgi:hypothetical protein